MYCEILSSEDDNSGGDLDADLVAYRLKAIFAHDANQGRRPFRNVQRKTAQPAIRMVVSN
jgi:hypothetical protein